jgi:hypothetical protein
MTDTTSTAVERRLPPVLRPTDMLPEDDGPIVLPSQPERRLLEEEIRSWKVGGELHDRTANARSSIAWNEHVEHYATALRPCSPGRPGTFIAGYRAGEDTMAAQLLDHFMADEYLGLDELAPGTTFIARRNGQRSEEVFVVVAGKAGAVAFLVPATGRKYREEDIDEDGFRGALNPPQPARPVPSN